MQLRIVRAMLILQMCMFECSNNQQSMLEQTSVQVSW
jgi:hypothetical protein